MTEKCPDCNVELVQAEYSGDPNLLICGNSECTSFEEEFI